MATFTYSDSVPRTYVFETGNVTVEPGDTHDFDSPPDDRWTPSGASATTDAAVTSTPEASGDTDAEAPVSEKGE